MRRSEFDEVMDALVDPAGPGAAVAVAIGDEVVHSAGYGLANIEWGIPIDAETVFRIGSITKQFTAAAILRLAAEGKLGIDDPLERHLPDYPVGGRRITLRHLLNHTSGIKSYSALPGVAGFIRNDLSLSELIDLFKDTPPDFAPGERYLYNNSGYVLLGAVIEAVSGKSYESFLTETFFEPLGLTHTRYLHDHPIVPKRASGYALMPQLRNAPPISMNLPHAAGALGSTAEDLLIWERALRRGQVVAPADYQAMITPGRLNDGSAMTYGLGLLVSDYRGHRSVGHGGGINGFLSDLVHWPEHELSIAILSNSGGFPVMQAAVGLSRRVLGLPDLVREAIPADDAELAAYAGAYRFPLGLVMAFKAKDGGLISAAPRPGSVYRPFEPDGFYLESDPEVTLRFTRRRDGACHEVAFESYSTPLIGLRLPPRG
jgi:CubicO group peptidase (beta-lactamase class C family)